MLMNIHIFKIKFSLGNTEQNLQPTFPLHKFTVQYTYYCCFTLFIFYAKRCKQRLLYIFTHNSA